MGTLGTVLDLSPVTPTAPVEAMDATRHDPIGARTFHREKIGAKPISTLVHNSDLCPIPWDAAPDEDNSTIRVTGEPLTTCHKSLNDDRDRFAVLRWRHRFTLGEAWPPTRVPAVARPIQIAPSVLPADFSRLGEEVAELEAAGVDLIQWDVMDGNFVPNLTFGPDVIASARPHTSLPFEAHLMVQDPDGMAARYVEAGCARLIVHVEACTHLHRTLENINALGATAAVAINPATPIDEIEHVLDLIDLILVMTVNPGFGGQSYISTMEPKITRVREMIERSGRSDDIDLEVDGGIGPGTIAGATAAGANVLIAGSALYRDPEGLAHAVADLRSRATAALG